ncbi:MAG: hypothetical protein ABR574_10630 [Cryomorphaceae bacterium]|nr:hypothetical protein [Flavobacteriales bacterium]
MNPQICFSQLEPFLLLEKPGTGNRIRYYIGDEIEFKRWDDPYFTKAGIVQLTDTSFILEGAREIKIAEVEALADRSNVQKVRNITTNAFFAIPVMVVFSAANNTFNTGETPVVDREVYPLSAIFAGVGALGFLYKGRKYRLKNKWRLIMVRH